MVQVDFEVVTVPDRRVVMRVAVWLGTFPTFVSVLVMLVMYVQVFVVERGVIVG